ncbi:MAG: hypothetical protein ACJ73S_03550 [Mycobacteriales bacterium]
MVVHPLLWTRRRFAIPGRDVPERARRARARHAPSHQAWTGTGWQHDPLVLDDQALVVHVRGPRPVVLTGCTR